MNDKNILRKKHRELRKVLSQKKERSLIIHKKLLSLLKNESLQIGIYCSLDEEVETYSLIEKLFENHQVYVPVIQEELCFQRITCLNDLNTKKHFSIPEPTYDVSKIVEGDALDVIIVPGVAFDRQKNRLGFGGGYFDRFFEKYSKPLKIGFAFDCQIEDILPTTEKDIQMDILISESMIYQ